MICRNEFNATERFLRMFDLQFTICVCLLSMNSELRLFNRKTSLSLGHESTLYDKAMLCHELQLLIMKNIFESYYEMNYPIVKKLLSRINKVSWPARSNEGVMLCHEALF